MQIKKKDHFNGESLIYIIAYDTYLSRDCFVPRNDALIVNYAALRRKTRIIKT
jgi:hypothetical protein